MDKTIEQVVEDWRELIKRPGLLHDEAHSLLLIAALRDLAQAQQKVATRV